jgi:hypothetical protein
MSGAPSGSRGDAVSDRTRSAAVVQEGDVLLPRKTDEDTEASIVRKVE